MARLQLRNLRKSYGNNEVLHGVSINVERGEFIVIVGPSGCGKSTLLRMVAGLESVSDGDIVIGERIVNELEPAERDIAMVFQNYALYPHMSVRQNMSYGLKIRGMPESLLRERVERVARSLELETLLERRPRELSGGQRQRVAMGRAIVREPAVFLFDEPLSNLDARLRVQMRLELELLHQRLRTTSLYVTHDQVEAMTLADRMIVLNEGKVEQIGTPDEVYARPASSFVASFIGSPPMNLLPLSHSEGQLHVEGEDGVPLGPAATPPGDLPPRVLLGVRPEHLFPVSADEALLSIIIRLVENQGANRFAHGRIGNHDIVVRLPADHTPHVGEALPLAANPADLHHFDIETEKRIQA